MEKTRNSVIDLFKNFGLAISKLVNDGEVDDVELTGELAKDPMEALKEYEASVKFVEEPVQAKTRAKAQTREKVQTREASAVKRTTRATRKEPTVKIVDDDEREM
ncbi:MAG: hypothetical protein ACLSWT_02165 [Clostridia bacterium]